MRIKDEIKGFYVLDWLINIIQYIRIYFMKHRLECTYFRMFCETCIFILLDNQICYLKNIFIFGG